MHTYSSDRVIPFRDFATDVSNEIVEKGGVVQLVASHSAQVNNADVYNVCINNLDDENAIKKSISLHHMNNLIAKNKAIFAKFQENGLKEIEYVFIYSGNIPFHDHRRIESSAGKRLEIVFRTVLEKMSDDVNLVSLASRDLGSFVHKCIVNVLPRYLDFEGSSAFIWNERSQSLQLAATTGLKVQRKKNNQSTPKKSDVKYYLDDKSFTSRCFKSKSVIAEYSKYKDLHRNTFGEDIGGIFNRYYFPIQIRDAVIKTRETEDELKEATSSTIGVLRLSNLLNFGQENRLSKINFCILKHFCEQLSVIGARYQASVRLSHELEQAFHGYTTDMAALSFRIQTVDLLCEDAAERCDRIINEIYRHEKSTEVKDDAPDTHQTLTSMVVSNLTEIQRVSLRQQRAISDAMSIHDGMGYQLEMVKLHNERETRTKAEICQLPYKEVFMRVESSMKDMIDQYHGTTAKRARLEWQDKGAIDNIQRIPPLLMSDDLLYLTVRNLVENSIKYTEIGSEIRVRIGWKVEGIYVVFKFEDEGMGINPKDEGRIFLEGWRSKEVRVEGIRGTGMGLAVCKAAIEAEEGTLRYLGKGSSGSGTTFEMKAKVASEIDIYS